jgi:hypothetical protein
MEKAEFEAVRKGDIIYGKEKRKLVFLPDELC